MAPQIIIDGEIITDSGTGVDDGALILFGNTDTSSAVGIPSSTYTFTSFSDYYYSKMYVDLVTPSTSAFEAKSVLNLSGENLYIYHSINRLMRIVDIYILSQGESLNLWYSRHSHLDNSIEPNTGTFQHHIESHIYNDD